MVILLNKTKQIEVLPNVDMAESFMARLKGLLGKDSLDTGEGLLIKPCNSIHCFFMKFPIDVAFVNSENKVIRVFDDMKPFSISPIVAGAKYVIEANSGAFKDRVEEGDFIDLV